MGQFSYPKTNSLWLNDEVIREEEVELNYCRLLDLLSQSLVYDTVTLL